MNNTTKITTELTDVEEIFSIEIWIVYYTVCGIIMITSTATNVNVITFYYSRKIRQSQFNYCLTYLSALNILQHVGILPYLIVDLTKVSSNLNYHTTTMICGFTDGTFLFFGFAFATAFTLTFISISRYRLISRPMKGHMSQKKTQCYLIACTISGVVLLVPNTMIWDLDQKHGYCVRNYHLGKIVGLVYAGALFFVGLIIPVTVMTITYLKTVVLLYRQKPTNLDKSKLRYRKHVILLLGSLIAIYLISWLPFGGYWITSIMGYYGTGISAEYKKIRILKIVFLPCISAGLLNALFYAVASKEFRRALKQFYFRNERTDNLKIVAEENSSKTRIAMVMTSF